MKVGQVNPPIIAGVVIEDEGTYLLICEASPRVHGLWHLPAGHVDIGESLEAAATREAHEETGLDVEIVGETLSVHYGDDGMPKHAFPARIVGGVLTYPTDETLMAAWFDLAAITKLPLRSEWPLVAIQELVDRYQRV
jgi:ADP-ribose pyrophosphatase YjhB (NUDIX family)